jgi:hypothetical protein
MNHQDEDQRVGNLREKDRSQRRDYADRESGHDRAEDRAETADHDDRERFDNDRIAHRRRHVGVRRVEHARQRRERHAECEHAADQAAGVDAERLRQFRLLGSGSDARAQPRALEREVDRRTHDQAHDDYEQPIGRIGREAEVRHAGQQRGRFIRRAERARGQSHSVLDHQHEREREEQIVERIQIVESPQKQHLDPETDRPDHERRHQERGKERQVDELRAVVGDECAQHVHRAVREIHDAQHTEDNAQAERQECVKAAVDEAVENLRADVGRRQAALRQEQWNGSAQRHGLRTAAGRFGGGYQSFLQSD